MPDYPFQLRVHKLKDETLAAEIITDGVIDLTHQVVDILEPFLERYAFVFLHLGKTSALDYTLEKTFKTLKNVDKLVVIAEKDLQIRFNLDMILRFCRLESALKVVDGNMGVARAVKKVGSLPVMNQSVFRLLKILKDPGVTFERLEKILNNEESIAESVVECANNTKAESERSFTGIKSVLSYQGLEGVRLILLELAFRIFEIIFANQGKDKLLHLKYSAFLMGRMANMVGLEKRAIRKMRIAGLYHDVGWLLMHHMFATDYPRVFGLMANGKTVYEAELEIFGITHQEIGEMIAHEIGLPDYLIPAVACHHTPDIYPKDLILNAMVVTNGFLNSIVERVVAYTPFEGRFSVLNDEYKRIIIEKGDKRNHSIADLNKIDDNGNVIISDIFDLPTVVKNLKEEYGIAEKTFRRAELESTSAEPSDDPESPDRPDDKPDSVD
ncbi:MAG: HDOD domain-containing protein [Candidatus Riflebacteria bacterium]|nr:HDOD domain-containing protein [Candidatus Riflebacteria bacterium]